jgi:hypothetical protein
MRLKIIFSGIIAATLALPAFADTYAVYVGYADNLRPSPFFPNGLCTGTYWNGAVAGPSGTCGGLTMDSGAVDIVNTGTTSMTLQGLTVEEQPGLGGILYNIWGTLSVTLAPGQNAVFTETNEYNFDTSDNPFISGTDPTNNCSTGADSTTALCTGNAPILTIVADGISSAFNDTGHVIDTGGYDTVNSNPCVGGNNTTTSNTPGNCNESLQWRLVGTTGIDNPGGSVPEPATLALLGLGLAGLAVRRRR